ncbi:hypothetical protein BDR04DRAFT_1108464 [Suillus decipiens]|nr:hypothetical protein BDR04DRAFT_1108464 [Suillus decipiens]
MSQEGESTNKPGRRVHQQASREDPPTGQGTSTNNQGGSTNESRKRVQKEGPPTSQGRGPTKEGQGEGTLTEPGKEE